MSSQTARPIHLIAESLGIRLDELVQFGGEKAKVKLHALTRLEPFPSGKYVVVTATNPTPLGEGKTTTAIGLAMGLCRSGRRAVVTLRQPSLGPVFGIKGGGTGGGKAQLVPMQDINLHFTGDAHAVAASHNLLAAFLENHLYYGNGLNLNPRCLYWPRAIGVSDRALRELSLRMGDEVESRETRFVLTEASEVMAIVALSSGGGDLRRRLGRIVVGMNRDGKPVTAEDLHCAGAMAVLLKDALLPNLVQTSEGTPAIVHAGPFANIAHGNSSILADKLALKCAEYVVTEAGFGSDLGAEKFFNIKCRTSGLRPQAAVVVVTLRALKLHGGGGAVRLGKPLPAGVTRPNRAALEKGISNLEQHLANVQAHGIPAVVAVNAFSNEEADELKFVCNRARQAGAVDAVVSTHWAEGGKGAEALAEAVVHACERPSRFAFLYEDAMPIKQKIHTIATRMYGAGTVRYSPQAEAHMELATRLGLGHLPICMAKTPLSLSHDPTLMGRPEGFTLPVNELRMATGAGFLTAVCSGMQLLPGLPKEPAGERIDLDLATGEVVGLA